MPQLIVMRHGRTAWNEDGRIQGRSDTSLSAAGQVQVSSWRLPVRMQQARWYVSPMRRALETAALLGSMSATVDERLIEMSFGAYEGRRLRDLREELGDALVENEIRGLDFLPPGGESPRQVAARFQSFLQDVCGIAGDIVVIAHKGILRASLVLACGWQMLGKPPVPIEDDVALVHQLYADGSLVLVSRLPLRAPA